MQVLLNLLNYFKIYRTVDARPKPTKLKSKLHVTSILKLEVISVWCMCVKG